jgi:hypothetical protein
MFPIGKWLVYDGTMKLFFSVGIFLAACGGGGNSKTVDAPLANVDARVDAPIDTPACAPAVPTMSTVIAPGGTVSASFVYGMEITSSGELVVLTYDGANGDEALQWQNGAWMPHSIYTGANGGAGSLSPLTEFAGKAAYIANISDASADSGYLRMWLQLDTGAFALPQRVDATNRSVATRARYSTAHQVLSVSGDDNLGHVVYSYERTAAGAWTAQPVAFSTITGQTVKSAGVGTFSDGTAAVAVRDSVNGFVLYRRTGTNWTQYRMLSAAVSSGQVVFPPDGTTGPGLALYTIGNAPNNIHGEFVSTADGTPTGSSDFGISIQQYAETAEVVYDPAGTGGKILVHADSTGPGGNRSWIVNFTNNQFAAAQEVRPDLVFDSAPHLIYHPCGGYMILHASRASTDAANSEPVVLEPLSTFAPGL